MKNVFLKPQTVYKTTAPYKYQKIDNFISRSAQPNKNNIKWLKENDVTDIINFRRDNEDFPVDFNEEKYVNANKMKYHNIPSYTNYPTEENLGKFLNIVENAKKNNGKVHIHCREGVDRTGMYAYLYERLYNLKPQAEAFTNFINYGWHYYSHPHLADFAEDFMKKIKF